jgi:hypothetical protein
MGAGQDLSKGSGAMATADGLEDRNRKLGRALIGVMLLLMAIAIIGVLTLN